MIDKLICGKPLHCANLHSMSSKNNGAANAQITIFSATYPEGVYQLTSPVLFALIIPHSVPLYSKFLLHFGFIRTNLMST